MTLVTFLTAFWSALDGRALSGLDRAASSAAFLNSLLECLPFLVKRVDKGNTDTLVTDEVRKLLAEQTARVIEEAVDQRLKVGSSVAGGSLARFMERCERGLRQGERKVVYSS
jgi:hypothetical protein